MKKGEYVKGEKRENNDVQTKQSFLKKKEIQKKGINREQHSRTRTNKIFFLKKNPRIKQTRKNQKKKKTDLQKQISLRKCPTKREMNEQVFFDLEKCVSKEDIKR